MSGTVGSSTSTASNKIRITGMATGIDTDSTVKQLMQSYQTRLDKLNQTKDLTQWKQDMYRDVIGEVNTFRNSFLQTNGSDSYMLSQNAYSNYTIKAFDSGTSNISSGVNVVANADAVEGSYSVDFSNGGHLAAAAGVTSNSSVAGASLTSKLSDLGITTTKITVGFTDNNGVFNSKDIIVDPNTMTISDLSKAINSSTNLVNARFSELTGKFTVQTSNTGASMGLSITDDTAGNILEKLNMAGAGVTTMDNTDGTYGMAPSDLSVKITAPGQATTTITKSTNSFSADGITYKFTSAAKNADISIASDNQKTFDNIVKFIDKYNTMVDDITKKLTDKKQYTYLPLTADQKSAMSSTDITNWETKAKTGLLHGDLMLGDMLSTMRNAFYDAVQGVGISLKDTGLSTSSDYTQNGKIVIDETKLKDAIQNNGKDLADIFSKQSTSYPIYDPTQTNAQRATRNKEEGIFQRLNDILLDYTRTSRDSGGKKGQLLEKAGIQGDYTEYSNLISKDISDQQKYIDDFTKKMSDKQDYYYTMFSKLETAMNNFNSQSSWLTQQLGSMK